MTFIKYVNILKHSFNILKSIWTALKEFTNSEYLHSHTQTHTQTNTHASTKNRNYIVQIPKKIDFNKETDKPIYQVHVDLRSKNTGNSFQTQIHGPFMKMDHTFINVRLWLQWPKDLQNIINRFQMLNDSRGPQVWFYIHDTLEKAILQGKQMSDRLSGTGKTTNEHDRGFMVVKSFISWVSWQVNECVHVSKLWSIH